MGNQIRAGLYLLSRSAYAKGAAVIQVLYGLVLLGVSIVPGQRMMPLAMLVTNMAGLLPFTACYLSAGFVRADLSQRGSRAAVLSREGRMRYVASRLVVVIASACALGVVTAVFCLVAGGLGVLLGFVAASRSAELVSCVSQACVQLLVACAYAALAAMLEWLSKRGISPLAVMVLLPIGAIEVFAVVLPLMLLDQYLAPNGALMGALQYLPYEIRSGMVEAAPLRALGVALVCIVLAALASRHRWARRAA